MPALQAHSTLRYAAWRQVIAEFVAGRTGQPPDSLLPVTLGYAVQGLFVAACEQWLAGADTDLGAADRRRGARAGRGVRAGVSAAAGTPRRPRPWSATAGPRP